MTYSKFQCMGCHEWFDHTMIHSCVARPGHSGYTLPDQEKPHITPEQLNKLLDEGRKLSEYVDAQIRDMRPNDPDERISHLEKEVEDLKRELAGTKRQAEKYLDILWELPEGLRPADLPYACVLHKRLPCPWCHK